MLLLPASRFGPFCCCVIVCVSHSDSTSSRPPEFILVYHLDSETCMILAAATSSWPLRSRRMRGLGTLESEPVRLPAFPVCFSSSVSLAHPRAVASSKIPVCLGHCPDLLQPLVPDVPPPTTADTLDQDVNRITAM